MAQTPFGALLEEAEAAFIAGDDAGWRDAMRVAHRAVAEVRASSDPVKQFMAGLRGLRELRDWHRRAGREVLARDAERAVEVLEDLAAKLVARSMN